MDIGFHDVNRRLLRHQAGHPVGSPSAAPTMWKRTMWRSKDTESVLSALSEELADLVEHVLPSVVTLRGLDAALHEWSGSGFVIDDQGHLVTKTWSTGWART